MVTVFDVNFKDNYHISDVFGIVDEFVQHLNSTYNLIQVIDFYNCIVLCSKNVKNDYTLSIFDTNSEKKQALMTLSFDVVKAMKRPQNVCYYFGYTDHGDRFFDYQNFLTKENFGQVVKNRKHLVLDVLTNGDFFNKVYDSTKKQIYEEKYQLKTPYQIQENFFNAFNASPAMPKLKPFEQIRQRQKLTDYERQVIFNSTYEQVLSKKRIYCQSQEVAENNKNLKFILENIEKYQPQENSEEDFEKLFAEHQIHKNCNNRRNIEQLSLENF